MSINTKCFFKFLSIISYIVLIIVFCIGLKTIYTYMHDLAVSKDTKNLISKKVIVITDYKSHISKNSLPEQIEELKSRLDNFESQFLTFKTDTAVQYSTLIRLFCFFSG
jgi:cell division protein FtsL